MSFFEVTSATLFMFQNNLFGTPYTDLGGSVIVDAGDYGISLEGTDFSNFVITHPAIGLISGDGGIGLKNMSSPLLIDAIHFASTNMKSWNKLGSDYWLALRLSFSMGTDMDGLDDYAVFDHPSGGGSPPFLVVHTTGPVNNLTQGVRYPTISEALGAAVNSDHIQVDPGVYAETVDLTGLNGVMLESTAWASNWLTNARISGSAGITITNGNYNTVRGFVVANCKNGVSLNTASTNIISHNTFLSNGTGNFDAGVRLQLSYGNSIFSNTCSYHIAVANWAYGIYLSSSAGNMIQNNILTHNETGLGITGDAASFSNQIINNLIASNNFEGARIQGDGNVIQANRFNNMVPTNPGLLLYGNHNRAVSNWSIDNYIGIQLEGAQYSLVYGNYITNSSSGIQIGNSDMNYIFGNTIIDSSSSGVNIPNSSFNNSICTNSIRNSGYAGIRLWNGNGSGTVIRENSLLGNQRGVLVEANNPNVDISCNAFVSNLTVGIGYSGSGSAGLTVFSNFFSGTVQADAVSLSQGTGALILCNTIRDAQNSGVLLNGHAGAVISNNRIFRCEGNAVKLNSSSGIHFMYNRLGNQTTGTGLNLSGSGVFLVQNSITNFSTGLKLDSGSALSNNLGNNIFGSSVWNLSSAVSSFVFTNIWWGSTVHSEISSGISGLTVPDYVPYRLFGPFDISADADITRPSIVTQINAVNIGSGTNGLSWGSVPGAVRYLVYRTNEASFSNFSKNAAKGSSLVSSWTDTGAPPGTLYYYITALDDGFPNGYTNESWYSLPCMPPMPPPTNVLIVAQDLWFNSITNALKSATNRDTIVVYPGHYHESLVITNIHINLIAYAYTNTGDNFSTVLDGSSGSGTVVEISGHENLLAGFTIIGGASYGINIYNGENNIIRGNRIVTNNVGLYISYIGGTPTNNLIVKNEIEGNNSHDIHIALENSDNNSLVSNRITGSATGDGIYIDTADGTLIRHNLIAGNGNGSGDAGINFYNGSTGNRVFHNTIVNNINDGINLGKTTGDPDAEILNNIIMGNNGWAIISTSALNPIVGFNNYFNNASGDLSGAFNQLGGDIIGDPWLTAGGNFEIMNAASPAVDGGTNILGINEQYEGNAPDMGWIESPYTNLEPLEFHEVY